MKKKLTTALITGVAGIAAFAPAANAAHCVSPDGDSPGFSYFGNDHVQESNHPEGGNPGPHAGTSGASNCRDTTGSPSDRSPGQAKKNS